MPTPENQITLRLDVKDMEDFKRLRGHMQSSTPLKIHDGDLHRLVYHRGIDALKTEYALDAKDPALIVEPVLTQYTEPSQTQE